MTDTSSYIPYLKKAKLMLCDNSIATRCNALKGMCILCDDISVVRYVFKHKYDILIIRELEGTASSGKEKLLAFSIIEKIIMVAPELVSKNIASSLGAVASYKKDEFRLQALSLLRMLTAKNPRVVSQTFGLMTLSNSILDEECKSLKASVILTLLQLADSPKVRSLFPYENLILHMYAPLLQIDVPQGSEAIKNWEAAAENVEIMLRSISGIYILTSSVTNGLKSIVNLLSQPIDMKLKNIVLKLISRAISFHTTKIKPSYKHKNVDKADNGNLNRKKSSFFDDTDEEDTDMMPLKIDSLDLNMSDRHAGEDKMNNILQQYWTRDTNDLRGKNMLDTYHGVLLLAFFHVGLVPVLLDLAGSFENEDISIFANSVLATYINCSEKILSTSQNEKITTIASMHLRLKQTKANIRINSSMISESDSIGIQNMRSMSLLKSLSYKTGIGIYRSQIIYAHCMMNNTFYNLAHTIRISNRSVDPAFKLIGESQREENVCVQTTNGVLTLGDHKKISYYMKQKKNMARPYSVVENQLKKSRVTQTKEVFDWNWIDIAQLFDGSLQHQKHLMSTMKLHDKFLKRVAGFYRLTKESKAYFTHLNWVQSHMPYVAILTKMMGILMESDKGIDFIAADRRGKILLQIVEELTALATNTPITSRSDNVATSVSRGRARSRISRHSTNSLEFIFSRFNMNKTMVREYFTLIGFLSSTMKGEQKLTEAGIFAVGTTLAMNPNFDYISRLLIANIDISRQGTPAQSAYVDKILSNALMKETTVSLDLLIQTLYAVGWSLLSGRANSSRWGITKLYQALKSPFVECVEVSLDILNCALREYAKEDNVKMLVECLRSDKKLSKGNEMSAKYYKLFRKTSILSRIIAVEDGFNYAKDLGWLAIALKKDDKMPIHDRSVFISTEMKIYNSLMPDKILNYARPQDVSTLLAEHNEGSSSGSFNSKMSFDSKNKKYANPTPFEFTGPWTQKHGDRGYASKTLNWFSRLPWHVNTVVADKLGQVSFDSDWSFKSKSGYLSSLSYENSNFLVIESVFLNEYGERTSIELKDDKSVSASLRIGSYEIDMDGFLRLNSNAMKNIHGISDDNVNRESSGSTNSNSNIANGSSINNNNNGSNNNQINISRRASFDEMPMIAQLRESRRNFLGGRPVSPTSTPLKGRLHSHSSHDDDSFGDDEDHYVESFEQLSLSTLQNHLKKMDVDEGTLEKDEEKRNLQINHRHGQWYLAYDNRCNTWHVTGVSFYVSLKPGLDLHVGFPDHLIEGLCKTEGGIELLMKEVMSYENLCKNAFDKTDDLKRQRFALWAIGYMASSESGFAYIINSTECDALGEVIRLATTSRYISVRGTCLYILGLMASFKQTRLKLRQYGWDTAEYAHSSCILPKNTENFFEFDGLIDQNTTKFEYKNDDVINYSMMEVLKEENNNMSTNFSLLYNSLIELTNPLSSKEALKKVKELRTKYPSLFTSTKMFLASYEILSSYRFQLHVRRYIHDIFKIGLENFSSQEEVDEEEKKV